jgi:hypothetical protein
VQVDSRREAQRIADNSDNETVIVDIMRRNQYRL